MMKKLIAIVICLVPLLASAETVIEFESAAVTARGMSPGARLVWFSVSRRADDYVTTVVRLEKIDTVAETGVSRFEIDGNVPLRSTWVVVDLENGQFTLASPPGYHLRRIEFPDKTLQQGNRGELSRFLDDRKGMELLLVRPTVGAWGYTVTDGDNSDDDRKRDGRVATKDLELWRPIGESPEPPKKIENGDIVVAIDWFNLTCYAKRMGIQN